ncbi:MAG: hypothetical protein Q9168_004038 [Polycauliona sp. 1 TL-2023]
MLANLAKSKSSSFSHCQCVFVSTAPIEVASLEPVKLSKRPIWGGDMPVFVHCAHWGIMRAAGPPKGQAFQHYQVTDNQDCGEGQCSVSQLETHTFGITLDVSIADDLGITKSWTSGETHNCEGDNDDTICVWVKVAYSIFDTKLHSEHCSNDGGEGWTG